MKWYFLGVFLLFSGSVFCDEQTPGIVVESGLVFDFGTYPANLQKEHVFKIVNSGKDDLLLGKVRVTCDCSVAELTKNKLKTDDTAELKTSIKAESIEGHFSKVIYVETNRKNEKFLKLTLKGNAVPLLRVEPSNFLYMGTLKTGQEYSFEFKLSYKENEVELSLPELEKGSIYTLKLEKKKGFYLLTVVVIPKEDGTYLEIEFDINIVKPEGWKSIKFKLTGKSAELEKS